MNGNEFPERFSPDGLTEQLIDALLREVDVAGAVWPRPSSALMDGTGAQRRYRRRARRSVAAVVRALPVHGTARWPWWVGGVTGGLRGWELPDTGAGSRYVINPFPAGQPLDAMRVSGQLVPVTTWVHPEQFVSGPGSGPVRALDTESLCTRRPGRRRRCRRDAGGLPGDRVVGVGGLGDRACGGGGRRNGCGGGDRAGVSAGADRGQWCRTPAPRGVLPVTTPPRVPRLDVDVTRPGGRCLPATRRVGAPESPAKAIEEIGMVQVHTCVSVHCGQCGASPAGLGFEAHYPTEDAALDAATAAGWVVGPGGRLWCSACGPVLECEADGHQFSTWLPARRDTGTGNEYRYCRRCCLHESRALALTSADVTGQVA